MIELPAGLTAVIDASIGFVYSFQPICDKTVVLGKPLILLSRP